MDVRFIPKEAVLERMENAKPFKLVEVLGREQYADRHLPGAISIPVDELEERAPHLLGQDEEIVVYCASYTCPASTTATRILMDMGYRNVLDYKGGKADWQKAGLPFEEGTPEQETDAAHARAP